jgi:hypothetical protein
MLNDNVVTLEQPLEPVPDVLDRVAKAKPTVIIAVGYDSEGDLFFASSVEDGAEALWLLESAKLQLLTIDLEGE